VENKSVVLEQITRGQNIDPTAMEDMRIATQVDPDTTTLEMGMASTKVAQMDLAPAAVPASLHTTTTTLVPVTLLTKNSSYVLLYKRDSMPKVCLNQEHQQRGRSSSFDQNKSRGLVPRDLF